MVSAVFRVYSRVCKFEGRRNSMFPQIFEIPWRALMGVKALGFGRRRAEVTNIARK